MSRRIKLSSLLIVLSCIISNAQDKLPNNSISFTAGMNFDGGYEVSIGTENHFNSNHTASLYGLINYHYAEENWYGQSVDCKKAMGEIGGKYYFRVVRNKFYPYLGLGITAGIQDIKQNTFYNSGESVVDEERDPFLLGGVGTVGLEYLFTPNVAIEVLGRFKYDSHMHYIIGGGLKFSF